MTKVHIKRTGTGIAGFQLIVFLLLLITAVGCKKEYESIEALDERNIQEYIQKNGLNMQQYDTTGIYYQVVKPGTGDAIDYTLQLPVIYTVKSLDGAYSSLDTIVNHYGNYFGYFSPDYLRTVIKTALMNQGGSIRIILPSRKAYGRNGNRTLGIPGNASLDFTVSVLEQRKLPEYEDQMIRKYLGSDAAGYTKSEDGIYYKITNAGTGSQITLDSTLTLNYTGKLLNGNTFESVDGASVILSNFIPAWQKAVPLIKEGGSIRFVFPSPLAYGMTGSTASYTGQSSIPAFSPLDFEVTVTDVAY